MPRTTKKVPAPPTEVGPQLPKQFCEGCGQSLASGSRQVDGKCYCLRCALEKQGSF